jgi:hypothetical protein
LTGGSSNDTETVVLTPENLDHIILKDMPGYVFEGLWQKLGPLNTFYVDNVECFKKDDCISVLKTLCKSTNNDTPDKKLEKFGLECTSFDIEEVTNEIENVIFTHRNYLKYVSFAKNNISIEFIYRIFESIKNGHTIETIDLQDLKNPNEMDWIVLIRNITKLHEPRKINYAHVSSGEKIRREEKYKK